MRQNKIHGCTWADQDWIGLMIFKNFADQDWIGFNFCGSGFQWCSRDRNRRDRNLLIISRRDRDRDFIKNSETEASKFVHFAEIKIKNVVITSDFLTCNYNKHKIVEL